MNAEEKNAMTEKIELTKANIRKALSDYGAHTSQNDIMNDVSEYFVETLAEDSVYAKQDLRALFRRSPVWDEELDALVINGTRTHDPDYGRVESLAWQILAGTEMCSSEYGELANALLIFTKPDMSEEDKNDSIRSLERLAPKVYSPTKKLSRVFMGLCKAANAVDDRPGSGFQRLYAKLADELTAKRIGFKLFVSLNPAHFLTMSNPKNDDRGSMMTSCHSLNSTAYTYNNGCSGYARDTTSFIAFTVSAPIKLEDLNNRKTTRQVFAYRPGSGLLMQSRMYNTSGGVYGAVAESKLYRDLIQREISDLENVPNLWKTFSATKENVAGLVETGRDFGGYPDWTYSSFDGHVSIRTDCDPAEVEPLQVGAAGLCISCACEISEGLYCDGCAPDRLCCDYCDAPCSEEDLYTVYDSGGNECRVCEECRRRHYTYCDCCEEYHIDDCVTELGNSLFYCDSCRDEYCECCEDCGDWYPREDMYAVGENKWWTCESCSEDYYRCEHCGNLVEGQDGTCDVCGRVL